MSRKIAINAFRQNLGQTSYGLWLGLPDASCAEICAGAGFDWVLVDAEHAPFGVDGVLNHLRAMAPYDCEVMVRPVSDERALLKQYCDIGVRNFLIPMVETVEQIDAIAASILYPPKGQRGLGTSLARAAHWNGIDNYLHDANDHMCLIVQAETEKALDNLEAIANHEAVQGVFIGPSDLSASMGHIGDAGNPTVVDTIKSAIATIAGAGKAAGILCLDPDLVKDYRDAGATFIGVGCDTLLLANAARKLAAELRGEVGGQARQASY